MFRNLLLQFSETVTETSESVLCIMYKGGNEDEKNSNDAADRICRSHDVPDGFCAGS